MSDFFASICLFIVATIISAIINIFIIYSYSNYMTKGIRENGYHELINGMKITFYQEDYER